MIITEMKIEHIKQVAKLEEICFSSPWSENALEEELENENAKFFVAIENTEVLGYAGMHLVLDEGFVTNIAVFPQHRQRKVARTLCEKLISLCDYSIGLEVRKSNQKAINLYENLGFKLEGERKNFYQNPLENALIYNLRREE